jgi:alginate O-acetyltransferase complex protein AlgI
MPLFAAVGLLLAAAAAVALFSRTARAAQVMFLFTLTMLPLPWLVRAPYQGRVAFAFAAGFLFISSADFASGRRPSRFLRRFLYIIGTVGLIDAMSFAPTARRFEPRAALRSVAAAAIAASAMILWNVASSLPPVFRMPLRIVLAAAMILAFTEFSTELVRLIAAGCGARFDPLHDHPVCSRSVTEFWSRRWNLLGGRWFRQHAFLPLRRRGVVFALIGTFALNAAMHVYLIAAVVPLRWMLYCAAFFLAQPLLIIVERLLRIRSWPAIAAHLWTIAVLTALLPLVLTPLLAALGLQL